MQRNRYKNVLSTTEKYMGTEKRQLRMYLFHPSLPISLFT